MKIYDHFTQAGDFFFRWRSYLPLLLLPIVLMSFSGYRYQFGSYALNLGWGVFCLFLAMFGTVIRFCVSGAVPSGTSGRNTKAQKADTLNTTGVYSILRNPLYLANYFVYLGLACFSRTWCLPIIVTLACILYYERIIFREEEFLQGKFGDKFLSWAKETPAIIPRFSHYRPSSLPFSWKAAIGREFHGLFAVTSAFFFFAWFGDLFLYGKIMFDPFWSILFAVGLFFYLTVLVMKKKTNLLKVTER